MNNMCVTHPPLEGKEDDKAKYAGRDVLHQFLTNGGYGATVQYYGTEDGILHLQPATKLDKCRHYDPRFAYVSVNVTHVCIKYANTIAITDSNYLIIGTRSLKLISVFI